MNSDVLRSKVVKGLFWLAGAKMFGQAITWAITLVVVRLLSPQDYGLMGMAALVNSFLLLFNELGLGAAIIQKPDLSQRHLSDLRWVIFLVNLGLFALVMAIAPSVGRYFQEPALVEIVRAIGTVFVLSGIGAPSSFVLIRRMDFKRKAQAELIGNVAAGLVTLAMAATGFGVWSLVGGYLVLQATSNALYCIYAPIALARPSFSGVAASLHFGSQVAATRVLWWTSSNADSVVVGRVLGASQLGYYGLALQFASIPLEKVVSLITQVALPAFSALQQDIATLRRYYLKLVGIIAFITFPIFIGLVLVSDAGIALLLTEKWAPIVFPLQILCLSSCLRAIETMNTPLLVAKGRAGIPMFNSLLQAIVLPLAFLIGTRWGVNGVAAAWLVTWPLLYALITGQTLRVLNMPVVSYLGVLKHPVLGCIAMAAIVLGARQLFDGHVSLLSVSVQCVSGALGYLAYYALFSRSTLRDVLETLRVRGVEPLAARQDIVARDGERPAGARAAAPETVGMGSR